MKVITILTSYLSLINFVPWYVVQHRYDEIVKWYQDMAEKFNDLVTFVPSIGKSYEGRDQPAVHITADAAAMKKIYFQVPNSSK